MQLGHQKPPKEMQTEEHVKARQATYGSARSQTQAWRYSEFLTSSSPLDQIWVFVYCSLTCDKGNFCKSNYEQVCRYRDHKKDTNSTATRQAAGSLKGAGQQPIKN